MLVGVNLSNIFINTTSAKNKAFFAETFGFVLLYFYIFIRLRPCWGGGWLLYK